MKKIALLIAVAVAGGGVVAFTASTAGSYLSKNRAGTASAMSCQGRPHQIHQLTIQNDKPNASRIAAKRCDILKITNYDERLRNMSFGVHNQHKAYNGVTEKMLAKNQSFSITLTETGSFLVHDHQQQAVGSTFTVSN